MRPCNPAERMYELVCSMSCMLGACLLAEVVLQVQVQLLEVWLKQARSSGHAVIATAPRRLQ